MEKIQAQKIRKFNGSFTEVIKVLNFHGRKSSPVTSWGKESHSLDGENPHQNEEDKVPENSFAGVISQTSFVSGKISDHESGIYTEKQKEKDETYIK